MCATLVRHDGCTITGAVDVADTVSGAEVFGKMRFGGVAETDDATFLSDMPAGPCLLLVATLLRTAKSEVPATDAAAEICVRCCSMRSFS